MNQHTKPGFSPTRRQMAYTACPIVIALCLCLKWNNSVASEWRSFRGNGPSTGVAGGLLPAVLDLEWTFVTDEAIESTAAITEGSVYVGSGDGHLYAVEAASGKAQWIFAASDAIKSSPTIDDSTVYFGDEMGGFYALSRADGALRWTYRTTGAITSSPSLFGNLIIFGSYDHGVYGLSADTGALLWKVQTGGYVHASPSRYGDAVVIAGCDGLLRLIGIDDGSERALLDVGSYVGSSAAIDEHRAYFGTFSNQVLAVDLNPLRIIWSFENSRHQFPFVASPALTSAAVLIGGRDKALHALDRVTGDNLWTYTAGGRLDASPAVVDQRVFIASTAGNLIACDLNNGVELWRYPVGAAITASPAIGAGKLIIGAHNGVIYCFGQKKGELTAESDQVYRK